VAHGNIRARGQAFVVFDRLQDAIEAHNNMKNQEIFGKPMIVQFARTKSDATILKEEGQEALQQHRKPRMDMWAKHKLQLEEQSALPQQPVKKAKTTDSKPTKPTGQDRTPPNKILFLENLPQGIVQTELVDMFSKFPGFVEVRLFAVRRLGFVEYMTDREAIMAKEAMTGLALNGSQVKITYAKK
jgi:U2 small nuclear ribonucleoprotein B''